MSENNFNWGIIGPGRIAGKFAHDLQVVDGASIYAIASRNEGRGALFAETWGVDVVYSSYAELINDPKVDAVYISNPHLYHFDQALLALKAGKPVLCEKPMTVNAKDTKKLIDTAHENNVFLMEAVWTRYLPVYEKVREWLHNGSIGRIVFVQSTFGLRFPRDKDDRILNPALAGGGLLDIGIYNIATAQWIMEADPVTIKASGMIGETGVDEITSVTMEYENGTTAQFTCTTLAEAENDVRIYGEKGWIRIHPQFLGAEAVTLHTDKEERTLQLPVRRGGFEFEIEEVMRCVRGGLTESPRMCHNDTLANVRIMDEIRRQLGLVYPFE